MYRGTWKKAQRDEREREKKIERERERDKERERKQRQREREMKGTWKEGSALRKPSDSCEPLRYNFFFHIRQSAIARKRQEM